MSICEGRLEVEGLAQLLRPPQREIGSPGLAPILATSILPDCVDTNSSSGQLGATSHNKLAHAVRNATEAEESASDAMLLKHITDGDKAAMHILFVRHRAKVFRFIQRMVRNRAIAEDLVSQVFLDVWRSANRFENRARVTTWLFSIARLKALCSLRDRKHEDIDQDDVVGIADAVDTPEAALDRKKTSAILRSCIDQLSPAQRDIIELVYYHDKSVAEASRIVGIPCATVKSRMFYARKQLARMLVNVGFEAATVRTDVDEGESRQPELRLPQSRAATLVGRDVPKSGPNMLTLSFVEFDPTRTSRRVQLDIQVAVKRLKQAPETTLGFGQLNE
jgi:RNA polymerase sigma-70 factor (ECF subfamily)